MIIKFTPNRVRRLYRGGSGIDHIRGDQPKDGYYPEDWIASCIDGNAREFVSVRHGLSKTIIDGNECYFRDLLAEKPEYYLGESHFKRFGPIPAVLVKFLDSSIRLPVQVHPTVPDAMKYFGVDNGKTEAWIILSCQPGACLYLGFNENLDRDVFMRESLEGRYHRGLDMLHKIPVGPGNVLVVYGGLPHAIGEGVTMVEIMEPSDLTINPERYLEDKVLEEKTRFANLPPETAMKLFDWQPYSLQEIKDRCFQVPKPIGDGRQCLIDRDKIGFFGAEELWLDGTYDLPMSKKTARIMVVAEGTIKLNNGEMELQAGQSAFLPYGMEQCRLEGHGKVVFVLPPKI